MIIEAKYVGHLPLVTIPGFEHRLAKRDEVVKLRIRDNNLLAGCWQITKGKKKYEDHVKALDKARTEKAQALADRKAAAAEAAMKKADEVVETKDAAANPKPDEKGTES